MRRETTAVEWLDGPVPADDLAASLDDIDRLNAWFGGYAVSLRGIRRAAARVPAHRPFLVVDVGGARGDLAVRVACWARRTGRTVRILVVDRDPQSLALGVRVSAAYPEISRVCADASALPLREASADVVTSALLLHHLDPDGVVAALGEMAAACRGSVIANDLIRAWWSWGLVWAATRLFARHRFSRDDGPLSVRRAYRGDELRVLAEKAGLSALRIVPHRLRARLLAVQP